MKKLIAIALIASPVFAFAAEQSDFAPHMPKAPQQEPAYQCLKTVDCMPIVSDDMAKYCANVQHYTEWARKNCGFTPQFTY